MTTYVIALKCGNKDVNCYSADDESLRNQMQASSILGRKTWNRTFQQLGHVRGWAKKAGKLMDEIRKFCQDKLQ